MSYTAIQITDKDAVKRVYDAALEESTTSHCVAGLPYLSYGELLGMMQHEHSVLVAVYDEVDEPVVFAVVAKVHQRGEWIIFCRPPEECFPDAVHVLIDGVVNAIGYYTGKVESPHLRELFASIPGVTIDGEEVITWKKAA